MVSFVLRINLITSELFIYKYLCVVVYKRMININDDFMSTFLNLTNTFVAGFLGLVATYTDDLCHDQMRYIGLPSELATSTPIKFE